MTTHTQAARLDDDGDTAAELSRQRDTSEMLLSVARALCESTDLPAVSGIIADAVPTVCDTDRGAVMLWDETTDTFVVSAISGWKGDLHRKLGLWAGTPFAAPELYALMSAGAPVLLDGAAQDWSHDVVEGFEIRALALVPIIVSGRSMGFVVAHWAESDPPTQLDEPMISRFTGLAGLAGVALDNNRLAGEIEWSVQHDRVTRLPNRQALERTLAGMVEQADATGGGTVVIVCDVDRFKRINDRLGQQAGDAVLHEVGERLKRVVRPGDTVARYGGDEFAITFARATHPDEVAPAIARIQRSFKQPITVEGQDVVLSLSMGVSALVDIGGEGTIAERAQRLAAAAESDLMEKKSARRATRGSTGAEDELQLDTDLHGAVTRGEIFAVYQPQIDLATGRIMAVEALARWRHPTHGLVRPDQFIALAEENGTIGEIGKQILRSACRDALGWQAEGHDVEVSVNVSAVQLETSGFTQALARDLKLLDFSPELLTVEVTESKVVSDMSVAQSELRAVSELGVGISVDDFGTGFSSLTQLSNLPVTELKIDRSFVGRMVDSGEKIVDAVIGLGHGLGLRVVAEGVETTEQLEALRRLGCDRIQGFLYSKPVETDKLLLMLQRQSETAAG